jgi:4-amino-4-deoxy-L-arabinose transferase-like glycosyltransferase
MAMIAENFYRHSFNILYPEINWAGRSGLVGTEFQLVTFVAALLYPSFSVQDWIGRSVSVLFFAASVLFFYLLVRKISNERSALLAVGIYTLVPLGIFTSRSIMPDIASLSFSIIALCLFAEWLDRERNLWLLAISCLATSLAILIKLPTAILGMPLLYMAWDKYGTGLLRRRDLWAFAFLALIFPLAWYLHAYLISISNFPYHFFGAGSLKLESLDRYMEILYRTIGSTLTPIVSTFMFVGIVLPSRGKSRVFHWWLLAIVLFIFGAGNGNARHPWYQLPILPVAAALSGMACDLLLSRFIKRDSKLVLASAYLMFFATLAYLSYIYLQPLYRSWGSPSLNAGIELDRIAPLDALVIAANNGDPTALYYSRRKGWHFPQASILSLPWPNNGPELVSELEQLKDHGGNYLLLTKYTFYLLTGKFSEFGRYLDSRYPRVKDTAEYIIFDLGGEIAK